MQERLQVVGETRYPKRSDFLEHEVVAIKAFLGPWPRALELAGIKTTDDDRLVRNREKRIRAKQKRNAERRANQRKSSNSDSAKAKIC